MTVRVLHPSEYARLEGTPLGDVWRQLPLAGLTVIVVEDADGAIVGHWTEFLCPHAENVWIAPPHRKRTVVARHLLARMRRELRAIGASAFITHSASEDVTQLLQTLGASRLPGDPYSVPVPKE